MMSLEEDLRLFDTRPNVISKQIKQNKFVVTKPQIDKFGLGSTCTRSNRPQVFRCKSVKKQTIDS